MAKKPGRLKAGAAAHVCLIQEDNLLRFLSAFDTPEELACAVDRGGDAAVLEAGRAILTTRGKIGAFLALEDLAPVVSLDSELAGLMLRTARQPLMPAPLLETVSLLPIFVAAPFALAYPGKILFDIKWTPEPKEWAKYIFLGIELSSKRLGLSQRLEALERRLAGQQATLEQVKGDEEKTANVLAAIGRTKAEKAKVEREADAINNAIRRRDLKGLAALIIRNINDEIKALNALRNAALAQRPPDAAEAQRLADEIMERSATINKVEKEIR
jgi:hypothetical protein